MRMVETEADGVMVVEAHGRLDSTTSKAFGDRLTSLLETGHGALVVDLKRTAYISSVGFQALLKASRAAAGLGCKFALLGSPTKEKPMPAKHASPKKLRVPEWYVSSFMMDRALDAVVRQIVKLDRRHDIPYLAGYSRDGKTIYIDRHMPKWFTFQARRINTDRFLILHEAVEKALIDHLGLRYLHAHQIATRAEQAAVRASGLTWQAYDRFMRKFVKRIGDEALSRVPRDLDLKPYQDEHDNTLLRRMAESLEQGRMRLGFRAYRVRDRRERA